ncbi:MAG: hypothetical protein BGO49_12350 [Planctomycetales bacterium 71-10]|nr:MAG: hypothetical protein BGO49_12350 [Planctomycetales bacterium 71-10]
MPRRRSLSLAAALVTAAVMVGCGDSGPDLVTVTGAVTQEGRPVGHAAVLFSPDPSNVALVPGEAVTDAEGRYRLVSDQRNGAVPGKYHVVIKRAAGSPPAGALPADASAAFKDDPFMASLSAGAGGPAPKKGKPKGPVIPSADDEFTFDIEVAAKGGAIDFDLKPAAPRTAAK